MLDLAISHAVKAVKVVALYAIWHVDAFLEWNRPGTGLIQTTGLDTTFSWSQVWSFVTGSTVYILLLVTVTVTYPDLQRQPCLVDDPVRRVHVQVQYMTPVHMDAETQVFVLAVHIHVCLHGDGLELF